MARNRIKNVTSDSVSDSDSLSLATYITFVTPYMGKRGKPRKPPEAILDLAELYRRRCKPGGKYALAAAVNLFATTTTTTILTRNINDLL